MTWPVHAAAAVLVSRFNPILGAVMAFFSHPVIDLAMIEYKVDWRKEEKLKPFLLWILWWGAACIALWYCASPFGRICIFISLSPDIIEIFHIGWGWLRGKDYWGKGDHLMPWHDETPVSKPQMSLWATVLVEVLFVAGALLFMNPGWVASAFHYISNLR